MAGSSAVISDDTRCALHDWHPVRIGHACHKDCTISKSLDLRGVPDRANLPGGDRLADRRARKQRFGALFQPVGSQSSRCLARLNRFRAGLDDEEFAGYTIFRPLHVHRATIMLFDGLGAARQLKYLVIGEDEGLAFAARGSLGQRPDAAAGRIDHLALLGPKTALDKRNRICTFEKGFEDTVGVRIDRALDDSLPKPPGGTYHDHVGETRFGID